MLAFTPPLQPGSTVTITLGRNGLDLPDRREVVQVDEASDCLYSVLSPLTEGSYRLDAQLSGGTMPAISGDFQVTSP